VPTIVAFGVWAIVVGEVGLAAATVTACSLGVVVDFTVHFLSKYLRAQREQGKSPEDAVRYALSTVGSALWVTSLVLVAGFSALALSSFLMNAHFGLLVAITVVAALLADFFLLPTLLMAVDRNRGKRPA
ncbi:MAG: MMPL family transporter, partial [Myxococcales bacterium]|nr:MMPL family transporter [Myxococcales bacterium]